MPVRNDFTPGEFCWVDLSAHDLESAAAWYGDLFGWKHMLMPGPAGAPPYGLFLQGEAVVGGIGQMSDEMQGMGLPPIWNSYIASADCAATEARVKELGATVTVPTMDVPGHGKLAFFSDPEGTSFAAWQTTSDASPGMLVGEPGSVCWNELMTRDVSEAATFYGALAGWDFASMPMGEVDYTLAKCGDKEAAGMLPLASDTDEPSRWMVYLAVEDCDALTAQVAATGGRVLAPPRDIPVGRFSVLSDPQGAVFGVIQLAAPE